MLMSLQVLLRPGPIQENTVSEHDSTQAQTSNADNFTTQEGPTLHDILRAWRTIVSLCEHPNGNQKHNHIEHIESKKSMRQDSSGTSTHSVIDVLHHLGHLSPSHSLTPAAFAFGSRSKDQLLAHPLRHRLR